MDILIGSGISILCLVALRVITQRTLKNMLELRPILSTGELAAVPSKDAVYDPSDYANVYNLTTLSPLRTDKDWLDRTVMSLFLFKCLRAGGYFGDDSVLTSGQDIGENHVFIARLLLRHVQLLQFNAHEIHEFLQVTEETMHGTKSAYIGVGVKDDIISQFFLSYFINHLL